MLYLGAIAGSLRCPGFEQMDGALAKDTKLQLSFGDKCILQLRFCFYISFNHKNSQGIDPGLAGGTIDPNKLQSGAFIRTTGVELNLALSDCQLKG